MTENYAVVFIQFVCMLGSPMGRNQEFRDDYISEYFIFLENQYKRTATILRNEIYKTCPKNPTFQGGNKNMGAWFCKFIVFLLKVGFLGHILQSIY